MAVIIFINEPFNVAVPMVSEALTTWENSCDEAKDAQHIYENIMLLPCQNHGF